jgi:hypothetical protein
MLSIYLPGSAFHRPAGARRLSEKTERRGGLVRTPALLNPTTTERVLLPSGRQEALPKVTPRFPKWQGGFPWSTFGGKPILDVYNLPNAAALPSSSPRRLVARCRPGPHIGDLAQMDQKKISHLRYVRSVAWP